MRARAFIGFVIVLELALIAAPRWARTDVSPEGFAAFGEPGGLRVSAPAQWQPVPEAMGPELQLALIGDDQDAGLARRLSVSRPFAVPPMSGEEFFEAIRGLPAGPAADGQVLVDRPVLVPGARAAYRRQVLIASEGQDGDARTFHFSRVWLLTPDGEVVEVQLIVQEPSVADPTNEILNSLRV